MSKASWDDKNFVLEQVQKNIYVLMFASDRLKDDEEIILVAVSNNGWALQYASDRLKSDVNFCIECAKKNPDSISYFLGKAKKIFQANNNDIVAVEQQSANKALLEKLSNSKIPISTNHLFKRKLLNV